MNRNRRVRTIASGVLVAAISTGVTLLALEFVLRFWFEMGAPIRIVDPITGGRYRPFYEEVAYSPTAGRSVHRRLNRLGFRGGDFPAERPAGTHRIAVMGDSFTVSMALDDGETLPAVLDRLLNHGGGLRWEVFNFGVDAFSPAQSLITWRTYARPLSPDVVVFCFFNGNDVSDDDRRLTNYPRPYFHLAGNGGLVFEPLPPFYASSTSWLGDNSRLYVWQKGRVQDLINRFRDGATRVPGVARFLDSQPGAEIEESWRLTEQVIVLFADEVRATGERFVLVSIPDLVQVRDRDWHTVRETVGSTVAARLQRDYPEARLAALARAHGITFVPLLEPLRSAAPTAELYLTDGHWNEAGTRIGAEVVLPVVEAEVRAPQGDGAPTT